MIQKFPPPKVLAVDIDGTLVCDRRLNGEVVRLCQAYKEKEFRLMLWSARGLSYAQAMVARYRMENLFDDVVSKPGFILDDKGWEWTRYTAVVPWRRML